MIAGSDMLRPAADGTPMPVVFVGHGSPMNAIEDNRWSRGFRALSILIPRPRAILAISAHWHVNGTHVTADESPKTIHDFSGFPPALEAIDYAAPGSTALAERVAGLVGPDRVKYSTDWGLDHGTWSVLRWLYPSADIPVVQLSIDRRLGPRGHLEIGHALSALRTEGVLIFASGNVTHNLRDAFERSRTEAPIAPDWARQFDADVARAVVERETERLLSLADSDDGRLSHPTQDHWFPLLYAYGASGPEDRVTFPTTGFDLGSLSMRTIVFA